MRVNSDTVSLVPSLVGGSNGPTTTFMVNMTLLTVVPSPQSLRKDLYLKQYNVNNTFMTDRSPDFPSQVLTVVINGQNSHTTYRWAMNYTK